MTNKILPLVLIIVFVFGWFCSSAYSTVLSTVSIIGSSGEADVHSAETPGINRYFFNNKEIDSPGDWISQEQIKMSPDKVTIFIDNPQWAIFTDTNSMDPVLDAGAHAIEIIPESENQLIKGDIISYNSEYSEGTIIHRIVDIGEDKEGWYCKVKGDNNAFEDPGKVRFSQIQRVLVAIIY